MNELIVQEETWLTPAQVVKRIDIVKQTMRDAMKPGAHYMTIPGTKSPTLLKPGAEVLCMLCQFRQGPPEVDIKELDGGHREYTITATLLDRTGAVAGSGTGSCSTMESKYRYVRGQERKDLADVYNTVLKMAHKRAFVAATLFACSASDLFTQDMEDMPGVFSADPEPVYDGPTYEYSIPFKSKGADMGQVRAYLKQHGARFDGDKKVWVSKTLISSDECPVDLSQYLVKSEVEQEEQPPVPDDDFFKV